jgi:hypothetical protein
MRNKNATSFCFLAILLLSVTSPAFAYAALLVAVAPSPKRPASHALPTDAPVDVYVGTYLNRIPALSFRDNQWSVDAYVWFRWKGNLAPPPQETFALCNGTIEKKEVTDSKTVRLRIGNKEEEYQYACIRIQAIVTSFWDVSRYPFDKHALTLVMEDNRESCLVRYLFDKDACVVDGACEMPGWSFGQPITKSYTHTYPTNYGDPQTRSECESRYSALRIDVPMTRATSLRYSLKVLNGLYVSVLIALLAFFVKAERVDVRFGTGVGAVFAAIASKYVIASSLPENGQLMLVDELYASGTAIIFLTLLESALAHQLFELGRHHAAKWLDRLTFLSLTAAYIAANFWLI